MKQNRESRHLVSTLSGVALVALLTLCFGAVWNLVYADTIAAPFYRRGNWVVVIIYLVLTLLVFRVYDCMRYGYLRQRDLVYYQFIATFIVNVITYFQISLIGRHFMPVVPMIALCAAEFLLIGCWTPLISRLYFKLFPPRRLVIVYGSRRAADLVLKMSTRVDKYMICESVDCAMGLTRISQLVTRYDGVILCDVPPGARDALLKICCANRLRVYVSPSVADILMRGGDEIRLFDTPLVLVRNEGLSAEQRFLKRAFDLLGASLLLLVASPFMLVCAAAVKIADGGPVLYRQKRLTRDGKVFEVLKFRSMIPDAEADGRAVLAEENDSRVTKVGKVLRRFRLDELPQLFNILRGDMSLVGPRPERPELAAEYEKAYPEFRYRLRVKAGLTGYAQVIGTYDTEPVDKLKMDLMYIEQYSFLLDIQILLMTLKTALFPPKTNEETRAELQKKEERK